MGGAAWEWKNGSPDRNRTCNAPLGKAPLYPGVTCTWRSALSSSQERICSGCCRHTSLAGRVVFAYMALWNLSLRVTESEDWKSLRTYSNFAGLIVWVKG